MAMSKDPAKRKKQLANLEKGKIKKGQVNNPKGRPRTTIRSMIAEFESAGLNVPSAQDISRIYMYIATLKEEELVATVKNKELPMMTRIVARNILAKKGLDVLERIIDRAYGKEQRIDITTNGKDINPEPLTIRFVADKEALAKIEQEIPVSGEKEGK